MGKIKLVLVLLPILLLAGCCIDEDGNYYAGNCPIKPTINATIQCDGASCGNSLNASSGANVSVWSYKNSGTNSVNLNVSIYAMPSKEITVVYTNEGNGYATLPFIPINTALKNEVYPYEEEEEYEFLKYPLLPPIEAVEDSDIKSDVKQAPSYKVWSEGNKYNWYSHQDYGATSRPSTLIKQLSVNGRTINIWVEDSEYADTDVVTRVNSIIPYISTIYASVVSVAGEPWGPHRSSGFISSDQPLDIVFCNLNGAGGYFWSANNHKYNQAVVVFVHTRMNTGYTMSAIAHELTHAVNLYQRYVLTGNFNANEYNAFAWLDEMTAVMMQDVITGKISYNDTASRYRHWLSAPLYHCDLNAGECDVYAMGGSFGAFLLRQYGIDFYKTLLKTSGSSISTIDKAIKVYDSSGLAKALRNWGASIAMFPAATAPEGFGYPERLNDNGFNLRALDGNTYRQYRKLPTYSPARLAPHAHFPFLRKTTNNAYYNESFVVPSGVGVSIVVK